MARCCGSSLRSRCDTRDSAALALDDGTAAHFMGRRLRRIACSRPNAGAYRVQGDVETRLPSIVCQLAGAADLVRPDSLSNALASLGIPPERIVARGLPLHTEAGELVLVQTDADGREHRLTPGAASAWHAMAEAARFDGVTIEVGSAFRSIERQTELIRRKLEAGVALDEILAVTAPPGYSEHHTGRAVDVTTPGTRALETEFEETAAFAWLARNAAAFGWSMSYARDNALGFVYEPWHWCYRGD